MITMNKIFKYIGLIFCLFLLLIILFLCFVFYLAETSELIFTQKDLEDLVNTTVIEFNKQWTSNPSYHEIVYIEAQAYFDKEINIAHNEGFISREDLVESYRIEKLLEYIHQKFKEKYPRDTIPNPRWCYNEIGGLYARNFLVLCNYFSYVTIWGTPIKASGFSGYYGNFLNEGDVMITGKMKSNSPDSRFCAPKTYTFGQTSRLRAKDRRYYELSDNCYMLSFALHDGTNMMKTFLPGLIIPYLFQNNDTKSFKIQFEDAMIGWKMWIMKELENRGWL